MIKSIKHGKMKTYVGYTINLKKGYMRTIQEKGQNILEEDTGKSSIQKNMLQKMKQYLENII